MALVRGLHHLTMSVGSAQEDYDFHTGVLGLYNVKKTALYDGKVPIYHLYYANRRGDASTVLTTFPFRQAGVMGRRGRERAAHHSVERIAARLADVLASHGRVPC